ncbi:MAG: ABC transporter ATP-binding protein [Acidobacteriota bacterium]|nr:ABC transporter ATP-binding protein [Acidobacteriota bacterium]
MNSDALIQLSGVEKSYRLGRILVRAVDAVSLEIGRGERVALAGPSGCGKTTLLNLIGCVDKPDAGRVVIDDIDVTSVPLHRLARTRAEVLGFVFQTFNLVPVLTAWENVEFPLLLRGVPKRERQQRVGAWLESVGLSAQAKQRPDQLSGGQRQRVAIARAMVGEPKLVVADEPTANLDSENSARILDLMSEINANTGCTFIFATHDPAVIARAQRVFHVRDGRITDIEPALAA